LANYKLVSLSFAGRFSRPNEWYWVGHKIPRSLVRQLYFQRNLKGWIWIKWRLFSLHLNLCNFNSKPKMGEIIVKRNSFNRIICDICFFPFIKDWIFKNLTVMFFITRHSHYDYTFFERPDNEDQVWSMIVILKICRADWFPYLWCLYSGFYLPWLSRIKDYQRWILQ
jgi:hypothetical protein